MQTSLSSKLKDTVHDVVNDIVALHIVIRGRIAEQRAAMRQNNNNNDDDDDNDDDDSLMSFNDPRCVGIVERFLMPNDAVTDADADDDEENDDDNDDESVSDKNIGSARRRALAELCADVIDLRRILLPQNDNNDDNDDDDNNDADVRSLAPSIERVCNAVFLQVISSVLASPTCVEIASSCRADSNVCRSRWLWKSRIAVDQAAWSAKFPPTAEFSTAQRRR